MQKSLAITEMLPQQIWWQLKSSYKSM